LTSPALLARLIAAALLALAPLLAVAAEIKVLSAGAIREPLMELVAQFERATSHKVTIVYGTSGTLRALLEKGENAGLLILPAEGIAEAEARGWARSGTRADLAAVAIGVAVRKGAPIPDIATPEALKRALLDATAVAYVDPTRGTSGRHAPLQKITTYSAALMPGATAREPTRELISFLTSPAGKAVFKAKGMDAAPGM
jgi:molybdate transport system substrate-binding protein